MSTRSLSAVVAVLALTSPFALAQSGKTWDKSYTISGKPSVEISAGGAGIHTSSCGGCRTVTIHVDARDQDLKDYIVEESANGNHISFHLKNREEWMGHRGNHGQSPEITVQTPTESDVDLRTGSGGLELTGVRGNLSVHSGSGGIRVQEAAGKLDAETGSGGLMADGGFSQFRMHSGSGAVALSLASGMQLTAGSSASSGSGGIRLSLPRDFKASVHASTGSGSIHSDLPLTTVGDWSRGRSVEGTLNGGGPSLELRTGSGGVQIKGI